MKNTIKATLAALVLVLMLPVTANAAGNVCIDDGALLLTAEEKQKLESELSGYDQTKNYLFVTENDYEYSDENMHEEMDEQYNDEFGSSDGIAFIINMKDRQLYMGGFGQCSKNLRSGDAVDITDNVHRYAKEGEYYECTSRAFKQANTVLNNGSILRPMRYIVSILLGCLLGFLIMFYVVLISRRGQKKTDRRPEGVGRTAIGAVIFTGAVDGVLINQHVTRHRNSSSSSSSGSGGGLSRGGGGSSGGGHGF